MIKSVKWLFVVLFFSSLISFSFVGKNTPTEGLTVGDKAPAFTIGDGTQEVSLSAMQGKYVLLSFWSSYDAESRVRNATLQHAAEADDRVEMVSVSFDEYQSIFDETIKKDQLFAEHCFVDLAGSSSPLYRKYRLDRGFKNYLLDENGVIVATQLSAAQLASYMQ
jgi:cytochrome oxidase Cu insertion factor (SCO1/SenC/PrrC family)